MPNELFAQIDMIKVNLFVDLFLMILTIDMFLVIKVIKGKIEDIELPDIIIGE
jgi:hypothetical protein